jgi:hypothetical protein
VSTRRRPRLPRVLAAAVFLAGAGGGAAWLMVQAVTSPSLAVAAGSPDGGPPGAPRSTVRITFQTVPPMKSEVRWGKKKLGFVMGPKKPFILERPRDSGPLDLVIKSEGFLTVHTRVYTFNDNRVFVKLTPITEKHKLFGYKQQPDGGADGGAGPDGGAPQPAGPAPPFAQPPPPAPGAPVPR